MKQVKVVVTIHANDDLIDDVREEVIGALEDYRDRERPESLSWSVEEEDEG